MSVLERELELRCPLGPRALLARLVKSGEPRIPVTSDNLIELSCRDCTRRARRDRPHEDITRVVHRYNILAELVESVTY